MSTTTDSEPDHAPPMPTVGASDDPLRTSEPSRRVVDRAHTALIVATIILVATVLATAITLRSTSLAVDADTEAVAQRSQQLEADGVTLRDANRQLADERHQLSLLIDGLQRTQDQLDLRTADRDQKAAAAEQTRIELFNLRSSLNAKQAQIYVQGNLLGQLQSCLRAADQALNALSHGDTTFGSAILEGAQESCKAVNDYLAQQGLAT